MGLSPARKPRALLLKRGRAERALCSQGHLSLQRKSSQAFLLAAGSGRERTEANLKGALGVGTGLC